MSPATLSDLLDLTAGATTDADTPTDHVEAHRLYDAAGTTVDALAGLQDTLRRECFGNPDRLGLCSRCGKVVDRSERAGHDPGGCLSIVAEPFVALVRIPRRLRLRARYHLASRMGQA